MSTTVPSGELTCEPQGDASRAALHDLVYENPELERLETILHTFNPFVALRWTRQELRHSAFLRWLLDPAETHGLGSYVLGLLLKRLARRSPGGPSVIDVDSWDLSRALVQTEWGCIDLLVRDDANRVVAVIENKVDSREHSDQLRRYREDVERHFPTHRKLFAYLTPGEDAPSDAAYVSMPYVELVQLLQDVLERRGDQLADNVREFISQYLEMVRRYIVEDSEIQALCRTIYEKHRHALDLIYEYRPDRGLELQALLLNALKQYPELEIDHSSKAYVRFVPKALDSLPRAGDGEWTPSKRMILWEFQNSGELKLAVILGPGEPSVRNGLRQLIQHHQDVFNRAKQPVYPKYWAFHIERWIGSKEYEGSALDDLRGQVDERLKRFVATNLPAMQEAIISGVST